MTQNLEFDNFRPLQVALEKLYSNRDNASRIAEVQPESKRSGIVDMIGKGLMGGAGLIGKGVQNYLQNNADQYIVDTQARNAKAGSAGGGYSKEYVNEAIHGPQNAPSQSEQFVMQKFGGDISKYNAWYGNLREADRPKSWTQAQQMLSGGGFEPTTLMKIATENGESGGLMDKLQSNLDSIGQDYVAPPPAKEYSYEEIFGSKPIFSE